LASGCSAETVWTYDAVRVRPRPRKEPDELDIAIADAQLQLRIIRLRVAALEAEHAHQLALRKLHGKFPYGKRRKSGTWRDGWL
jgi:hypothetical protein